MNKPSVKHIVILFLGMAAAHMVNFMQELNLKTAIITQVVFVITFLAQIVLTNLILSDNMSFETKYVISVGTATIVSLLAAILYHVTI
jgi:hypothetical protein